MQKTSELMSEPETKQRFGLDRLQDQLVEFVLGEFSDVQSEARGASAIEKLLYLAILTMSRFGATEYQEILVPRDEEHEAELLNGSGHPYRDELIRTALIIRPQATIGSRRVDFLVHACEHFTGKWRRLIVECDGHDFHERTKEQARRDRSRDRLALMDGYACFRFTGSEIWQDPWGCATEVLEWAALGWGGFKPLS